MERLHRTELDKVESKRAHEAQVKTQELKDLNETFNAEMGRMNDVVNTKEKNIASLNEALNEEKERYLELTKNSTGDITNLVHDKNRLNEEIDHLNGELAATKEERAIFGQATDRNIAALEGVINNLKEELEHSHLNFLREKDQFAMMADNLHR